MARVIPQVSRGPREATRAVQREAVVTPSLTQHPSLGAVSLHGTDGWTCGQGALRAGDTPSGISAKYGSFNALVYETRV